MTTATEPVHIEPLYINRPEALQQLAVELAEAPWLAIDTEFVREQTYYAVPCLLQIASPDRLALIDTCALPDLTPLHALLGDSRCIKIMHAASQDLELLYQQGVPLLSPLFDTQIAAALLGAPDQMGYAALVQERLQITLDKEAQRTDWSRRPLSTQQLQYAADDVRHLGTLYVLLSESLASRERYDWLWAETARLSNPDRYRIDVTQAWRRLKGLSRLRPAEQARLRALAVWREEAAINADRPRKWILHDDVLYTLARKAPVDGAALAAAGVPPATQRRHGDVLLTLLQNAENAGLPAVTDIEWSEAQRSQLKRWAEMVQAIANSRQIAASQLATRAELEKLLLNDPRALPLLGWRKSVVGDVLLAAR